MGDVANAESNGHRIGALVGHRHGLARAGGEMQMRRFFDRGAFSTFIISLLASIIWALNCAPNFCARLRPKRDVTGAAGHIDKVLRAARADVQSLNHPCLYKRCSPPDIKSFITSYLSATASNTPRTMACLSSRNRSKAEIDRLRRRLVILCLFAHCAATIAHWRG